MCRQNEIIPICFYLTLIWITLITSSEVVASSNNCPGEPNLVTSSTPETIVNIIFSYNRKCHGWLQVKDCITKIGPNGKRSSLGGNCTWIIERNDCSSRGVEVVFKRLERLRSPDSVTVFDGPSMAYPKLETFIVHSRARSSFGPIRSSGRFITVVLQSVNDTIYDKGRPQLRYRDTPKGLFPSNAENKNTENRVSDTCGEELLMAYQKPNFITSPGYPRGYKNSLYCKWTVKSDDVCNDDVIQVTIHTLSLDEIYDHLVIYDGDTELDPVLTKLSGNEEPQVIMASGTSIVIEFKTDDTAPGRGFHLSYIRTKATPSLSESVTINRTRRLTEMSVDFISGTPHRAVYWSKKDVIIQKDAKHISTVTPTKVSIGLEPDVTVDGFRASLVITDPDSLNFGMYKVAVRNKFGVSERTVFLRRGNSAPIIQNHAVFSENATMMVTFSSNPNFTVEWYTTPRILNSGSGVDITTELVIHEENGDENEDIYMSVLSRATTTELDYGDYLCIIRNSIGTAEIYMHMDYPETELPKLLVTPSALEISKQRIILSVNFDSNIAHPVATWYRGNVQLGTSGKYSPELKWNRISSWHSNTEYPPALRSMVFKPDRRIHDGQHYAHARYNYPSIGGSRSSTHPYANYTAMLTISDITPEDIDVYRVVLQNGAGILRHVIDVIKPEVFPFATCDQADIIRLVCYVTSCSVFQSWIHSVGGDVIRHLPGHQDGPVNTLIIPMCMHSDAGTYTCVATEKETGSDLAIHHDRTTLTVRAAPVILETTVNIHSDSIHIQVPFYSNPSPRQVTWYRNGGQISSPHSGTIATEPHMVNLPMHGRTCSQAGHVTSISVPVPTAEDFGIYKITISNEMGNSEHFIDVQNPEYVNPVTSSDVSVSYDGGSALLNVTFSSYYPDPSVRWYFRGQKVRENHPINKYVIQTDPSGNVTDSSPLVRTEDTKSTILTVTCVAEDDYGIYDVIVSNKAGKAVIPVKLTRQGIPEIVGEMVTKVTNSTGEIAATFHSTSGYRLIRWFKEDKEIVDDSCKYSIVNEDIDIELSSNGETVEKNGTITRLVVTSLEDKDYVLYTVQIYTDVGMTDRSVSLDEECA